MTPILLAVMTIAAVVEAMAIAALLVWIGRLRRLLRGGAIIIVARRTRRAEVERN